MEQTGSERCVGVVKVYMVRRVRGVTKMLKTLKDKLKQNTITRIFLLSLHIQHKSFFSNECLFVSLFHVVFIVVPLNLN